MKQSITSLTIVVDGRYPKVLLMLNKRLIEKPVKDIYPFFHVYLVERLSTAGALLKSF